MLALDKLYEIVLEKGLGGLLAPWQEKRVAKAKTQAKVYEMLSLAQAKEEKKKIENGTHTFQNGKLVQRAPTESETTVLELKNFQPVMPQNFGRNIGHQIYHEELRKKINVSETLAFTAMELENDTIEASEDKVDDDWLYKWRDCAAETSSEEMQKLWGSILAGEIRNPGYLTIRAMEFLKNMSKEDARFIEHFYSLVIGSFLAIYKLEEWSIVGDYYLDGFIELESLGLISGCHGFLTGKLGSEIEGKYQSHISYQDKYLRVSAEETSRVVVLPQYKLTALGNELRKLVKPKFNQKYLGILIEGIKSQGFEVEVAQIIERSGANLLHSPFIKA